MNCDLVITYVDQSDPLWFQDFAEQCRLNNRDPHAPSRRFREWNTLRYILRGTHVCMPWINRIHLVVERPSQVPQWVRPDRVNIVLHPFIIPAKHLPTYNSTCIEMFLHRIPGLSEHYLYANDDMIPLNPLSPSDFFDDLGDPRLASVRSPFSFTSNMYTHHLHNGEATVRRLLGMPQRRSGVTRTGHNIAPMRKSTWDMLWDKAEADIRRSLTTFRAHRNINQELAAYWHLLTGTCSPSQRTAVYTDMRDTGRVCSLITGSDAQLICINDAKCANYSAAKKAITEAFETRFPEPSPYEYPQQPTQP